MQINSERFWKVADAITTECPLCAFLRGFAVGAVLGAVVVAGAMCLI